MARMANPGGELLMKIAAAMGMDGTRIQRVIIDVAAGDFVRVYVQAVGSEELLNLDWPGFLTDVQITTAPTPDEVTKAKLAKDVLQEFRDELRRSNL